MFSKTALSSWLVAAFALFSLAGISQAASIKAVPSVSAAGYGETFAVDIVVDGIPADGLGTVQFRLNASAPGTVVTGVSDPSLGSPGNISFVTPLTIGPSTPTLSGIGDFFWNARSANGILFMDNEALLNGTALYSFSHTNGAVLPSGSGTIARFLVKAGAGITADHMTVSLSDVALLNGDEVFSLDANTAADIQLRCKSTMPSLLGLSYQDAVNALTAANLTMGTVYELDNTNGSLALNVVLQQSTAAGSQIFCGSSINFAINNPPTGSISINGGAALANDPTVMLTLGCLDAMNSCAKMQFRNDNSSWSTPENYAPTKSWALSSGDGPKTVYVKFIDNLGNTSVVYSAGITLETTHFVTPSAGANGTISPNARQTVLYGSLISFTVTPDAGYHIVSVTGCGGALSGNTYITGPITADCGVSATFAVNPDTTPPTGSVSIYGGAEYVNTTAVTLTLTCSDGGSGCAQALISNDNDGAPTIYPFAANQAWTLSPEDGPKTVSAQFKDIAGNTSSAYTASITLDTTAPALTLSALADGAYTNGATANFTGTLYDANGIKDLVVSAETGTQVISLATADNRNYTYSWPVTLVTGTNVITLTAADLASNTTMTTRTIYYDTTAPGLTITAPADNSFTNMPTTAVTGTVDTAVQSVVVSTTTGTVMADMDGNVFSAPTVTLAPGMNTISIIVTDLAGNATTAKRTVTFDDVSPALAITGPNQDMGTAQNAITLSGTVSDITGVGLLADSATASVGVVSMSTTASWTVGITNLQLGVNTITITATDQAGNSTTAQRNIILTTTPITIQPVTSPTNSNTQTVTGTRALNATVAVTCAKANVGEVTYPTDTAWSVDLSLMTEGTNTISVTATDLEGNASAPATAVIVLDTTPPEVIWADPFPGSAGVPENTTIAATLSELMDPASIIDSTFYVNGVNGTVTYDAGAKTATFTPSTSLAPGATYMPTISTGVKDLAGNAITSYSWSFTVAKATPAVTVWSAASGITYGQALSASTLSGGTAAVTGSFAFTSPSMTPNAGAYSASVTFTPSDTTTYNTVMGIAHVAVAKATPAVTAWPAASVITYGQALSASTLSGGTAAVTGSFAFSTPSMTPNAGAYNASVIFTPNDTSNNNTVTGGVNVTVQKRALTITATGVNKVYDGTTIAAVTLSDNRLAGDIFTVSYASASFADPIAGTGKTVNVSGISASGASAGNYTWNTTAVTTANITKATTTTTATVSASSVRYKDLITLSAKVVPQNTGSPLTGSVSFQIGTASYGSATTAPIPGDPQGTVQAALTVQVSELPGTFNVTAAFTSTNSNYTGSSGTTSLTVIPRDASPYLATGYYTGDIFAWTGGQNSNTATVTLSTTIKDNNMPTGDVRAAKVTFYTYNNGTLTPISSAQNLPVGLVNTTDGTVGTASAVAQLSIGSANSGSFMIVVGVGGGYKNNTNDPSAMQLVSVARPIPGGRILGMTPKLSNTNTAGTIAGVGGQITSSYFDVTYNKNLTNPQGKTTVMIMSQYKADGTLDTVPHAYFVKSNAISTLAVTTPKASFSSKATVQEILSDGTILNVDGGAILQLTMTASTNAGVASTLGITVQKSKGGLWFSSNWNGTKTVEQGIVAGTIQVQ